MSAKSTKVLIVEDSPSQAAIIASIVVEAGYQPTIYTDITTGISQILLKEQPDLVLLDLMLLGPGGKPMADGFQICREIKRVMPSTPVVVVTAEEDDDACEWAILQGADAFLQKPFAPQDLTEVITDVMGSRN